MRKFPLPPCNLSLQNKHTPGAPESNKILGCRKAQMIIPLWKERFRIHKWLETVMESSDICKYREKPVGVWAMMSDQTVCLIVALGRVQMAFWAGLQTATGCLPSACPNGEHPEATCTSAARHSSTLWVPWGCTKPMKIHPEKVLIFWGDFLGGASMEHSILCLDGDGALRVYAPPCKRPSCGWLGKLAAQSGVLQGQGVRMP